MHRVAAALRRLFVLLTAPNAIVCWLVLALAPLLYAGRYNHPSNDDYFNAVWKDYFGFQKWLYLHSTGRYFSSLIVSFTPLHWHSWTGYRMAAWLLIIALAAVMFLAVLRLCGKVAELSRRARYALAAGAVFVLFNGMASPEQGLYWYTGAMTYTLAALLFICFLSLCLRLDREVQVASIPLRAFAMAALLLLCVIGSNETIIPLPFIVCGALAVYYRKSGSANLARFYIWLLLVCCIGAAAALLAPGNGERQEGIPRSLAVALPSWLLFTKDMFLGWLREPFLQLYSIGALVAARRIKLRCRVPLWVAFVAPLVLTCAMTLPGFWALGRMPPYRAQNIAYLFFLIFWAFFLIQLAGRMQPLWDDGRHLSRPLRELLGIAAAVCALQGFNVDELRRSSNYFLLAKNLAQGTLRHFDAEEEARYALLRHTSADSLVLQPLCYRHHNSLYFADISPDAHAFPNPEFAKFWGKRKVWLDTAGASQR